MSLKADTEKKGTYLQIYGVLFDKLVRRFPQNERDVVEKEKKRFSSVGPVLNLCDWVIYHGSNVIQCFTYCVMV